MGNLGKFEGLDVMAVGVEMPNAAGGLQEAMKFDPVEFHQGDEGYIVLHYTVTKVRFEPMVRDNVRGPQRRVHVLNVDEAAPIDSKYVQEQLAEHRERIKKAKDEMVGTPALDLDGEPGPGDQQPAEDPPAEKSNVRSLVGKGRKKTTAKKTTGRGAGKKRT